MSVRTLQGIWFAISFTDHLTSHTTVKSHTVKIPRAARNDNYLHTKLCFSFRTHFTFERSIRMCRIWWKPECLPTRALDQLSYRPAVRRGMRPQTPSRVRLPLPVEI